MKHIIKTNVLKFIFTLFLVLIYPYLINCQSINYVRDYLNWFDEVTGIENSGLHNGILYTEKYNVINEKHKFFLTSNFLPGYIIFDGEPYYGIEIKYDLFEDEILIKLNSVLLLDKNKIDSFIINDQHLINIHDKYAKENNINGFYEIPLNTPFFKFLIKHRKEKTERVGNIHIYHEFSSKNQFYLFYNNIYYPIKNRKSLLKIFPEFKNEINNSSIKSEKKSDNTKYLLNLVNLIYKMKIEEFKNLKE